MSRAFAYPDLLAMCQSLLAAFDVAPPLRADMAEILLEGDLMGHDTHGLALLPMYLDHLDRGITARSGTHEVVEARKASALWDGRRLPGAHLVNQAIVAAQTMAAVCGTGTVVIRRSQHIGCLAAYLRRATEIGHIMILSSSDPSVASVCAYGGRTPVFTPNPIAIGFPTVGDPVLIDISASLTTNGMSRRLHAQGRRFAHPCLQDADGHPSDDPSVLFTQPPGTILPLGGLHAGHKGYGLALMIEALTGGLAGRGRADPAEGPGATVFVQLLDPEAFAGAEATRRQMQFLADTCRQSPPAPGFERVRLPGELALVKRREQVERGVQLGDGIVAALKPWLDRCRVDLPNPC